MGESLYIEVKATKAKSSDANFYLSANELEFAKGRFNYWLYVVFEVDTSAPKIWRINNPFSILGDEIILVPISYKVKIGVE